MKIGTLVIWSKTDPRDERPEATKRLPAWVNEVWPDEKIVGLWVFSPDGQFISRMTPVSQLEIIADPDILGAMMTQLPTMLNKIIGDVEALKEVPMTSQAVIEEGKLRQLIAKVNDDWTETAKGQSDRITELSSRLSRLESSLGESVDSSRPETPNKRK